MLVLGCRLNEPTSAGDAIPAPSTRWAHVDLVPRRPDGLPVADLSITADARAFLRAANERLVGKAVLDAGLVRIRQEHAGAAEHAAPRER